MKLFCKGCKKVSEFTENTDDKGYYINTKCQVCGFEYNSDDRCFDMHPYTGKCKKCGREITIYTQDDNRPEYYTNIGVQCSLCGDILFIEIPVN